MDTEVGLVANQSGAWQGEQELRKEVVSYVSLFSLIR